MKTILRKTARLASAGMLSLLTTVAFDAQAVVDGVTGPGFVFSADTANIPTPDGDSVLIWGYNSQGVQGHPNAAQLPGPTMIVNQGERVTVTLTNNGIDESVSIVFPGQENVTAICTVGICPTGVLTLESDGPSATVEYSFTATHPGTYLYHSGSNQALQREMGLFGALIVRPTAANQAYDHVDTAYDQEYLFLLSEMDPEIHQRVDFGFKSTVDFSQYTPKLWFINGRNGPDTLAEAFLPTQPSQPYNSLPRTHPRENVLMRVIGGSRHAHPFHTHSANFRLIAQDGRMLESNPGVSGPDAGRSDYTLKTVPGQTYDAIWTWTGEGIGWDIYGDPTATATAHTCDGLLVASAAIDATTGEDCNDHGVPLPVTLPELKDLTFGGFWSGSEFLGQLGTLPPGEGGLNLFGGLAHMWHSHSEKELGNNDVVPGGMMTFMLVEHPDVPIP